MNVPSKRMYFIYFHLFGESLNGDKLKNKNTTHCQKKVVMLTLAPGSTALRFCASVALSFLYQRTFFIFYLKDALVI